MKKKLAFFLSFIIFMMSVGTAAWNIDIQEEIRPNLTPSGLTDYIAGATNTSYIYDQGTTASSYKNISTDITYNSALKTIHLGYSNTELEISQDTHFTHADKQVAYTESDYDGTSFHTADGSTETVTFYDEDGNSQNYYYSSKANATNAKQSTISARSQWINYYYHDHTVNHYSSDGTYKKLTLPSGRLYTIKLVGDVVLKAGKSLSIGAFIGSTSNGFAGPMIEGNFVVLDLNGHTLTIESGATLNAYGYIIDSSRDLQGKHKGKIVNYGTIYSGFVVENYSGGGNTLGTAAYYTAPFSMYTTPYLVCKTIFKYGSMLKGPTSLYASSVFSKTVVNLIGPNNDNSFMIGLYENAELTRDSYQPYDKSSSQNYAQETEIYYDLNGDFSINTIKMQITFDLPVVNDITKTINMAEFGLTIPSYFHFNLRNGTTTLYMQVDFLPGSTLDVQSTATISLTNSTLPASETIADQNIAVYGGIRMLNHMSADGSYCYKGLSYGASISYYNKYRTAEAEISGAGNLEARANIYGKVITTSNTTGNHWLSGKINFHNSEQNINLEAVTTFTKDYECYAYLNPNTSNMIALYANQTGAKIRELADPEVYSSYNILPLVSNGYVIEPSTISSIFQGPTQYDFNEGVYYYNGKTYAYITNDTAGDVSGNIYEVTHDADNHQIIYNNKRYTFYRNVFVNNASAVQEELYVYDGYCEYSNYDYNAINLSNNTVDFAYYYEGIGSTETATIKSITTRTRTWSNGFFGFGADWKDWSYSNPSSISDSDWDAENNIVWDTENAIITSNVVDNQSKTYYNSTYDSNDSVNVDSYTFTSGKDVENYTEIATLSLTNRPMIASKFNIVDSTQQYIQVGTVQLSYLILEGSISTSWNVNASAATDEYSENTEKSRQTQYKQTTATRSIVSVSQQQWSYTTKTYIIANKSSLKWDSTNMMWIKRA